MIQFTEAIQLYNGQLLRLEYHQQRVNRTLAHFYPCANIDLQTLVDIIPQKSMQGLFKCRLVYDESICDIQWQPYTRKLRQRVLLVNANMIDYQYKYCNRVLFENLHQTYPADDLILIKHGNITDSLYANLVFENHHGLYTPDTPLLQGTRRQQLINDKIISIAHITLQSLSQYQWVHFVNAMIDIGDIPPISVNNILTSSY